MIIGVPSITIEKHRFTTTGGLSISDVWTKLEPPYMLITFKALNPADLVLDTYYKIHVTYPPYMDGYQDSKIVNMKLITEKKVYPTQTTAGYTEYTFKSYLF